MRASEPTTHMGRKRGIDMLKAVKIRISQLRNTERGRLLRKEHGSKSHRIGGTGNVSSILLVSTAT